MDGKQGVTTRIASVEPLSENKEFLTRQLITYIGNKRALLALIGEGVAHARRRLNKRKLSMFDVFSGSGIVARYFKQFSELLIVNDLEKYSAVINECYLTNKDALNMDVLHTYYHAVLEEVGRGLRKGIISELYAPQNDAHIKAGERAFYTSRNARYIDTVRQVIEALPPAMRKYFLAPLLSEASIHANTAGVFKGFYKNKETGAGQFGGLQRHALGRITGDITLPFPVFSNFNCETVVCSGDSNTIIGDLPEVDIAYVDPPYNQHPYGSNYFMLNVIVDYNYPERTSAISGIPEGWNRSHYNKAKESLKTLAHLVEHIKARYVIVSFNSEGFISCTEMKDMLAKTGKVDVLETTYNAFRGSRNLRNRGRHVKEYVYVLEK
ncbi:MAG: DNA adenine methylase [Treponema sp.]|jgi:adenine-specific DNA-methyltransferase|nr:DNA adenine methylase [Treponema sp.]